MCALRHFGRAAMFPSSSVSASINIAVEGASGAFPCISAFTFIITPRPCWSCLHAHIVDISFVELGVPPQWVHPQFHACFVCSASASVSEVCPCWWRASVRVFPHLHPRLWSTICSEMSVKCATPSTPPNNQFFFRDSPFPFISLGTIP